MGEAKRKAALAAKLGETRADGFDAFGDEVARLRATPGAREDQLDRLRFHELFSVALVEGCRERAGFDLSAEREVALIEAWRRVAVLRRHSSAAWVMAQRTSRSRR